MQPAAPDLSRKDRSTAFFIFGFLLACYLLTFTGAIDSSDGLSMFATTESIVRHGGFDSNQLLWMGNQQGNLGVDGSLYTRKGLGMVLLGLPLVWIAQLWSAIGLVHAALLLNPLLTAWTGALLFRTGRRLGWSRGTATATALLFGLATMAWPYTQTYFSDPVCGWALLAAAYGLLAYAQSGRKLYLWGAGTAWALAYLTRTVNLFTLPVYVVGLAFALATVQALVHQDDWTARVRAAFWVYWRPVVAFTIPVALGAVISLWWNWTRFGSLWETGYVETETFSADWLFGLLGLTIGPGRGFLWYNPVLLLALPGAIWFWRRQRRLLFLDLALVAIYFTVYAKWYMWHGGYSWGPRFLVPVLPFVTLLAGPAWDSLVARRRFGWLGWSLTIMLAALSVGVQWLGMLVPYAMVQDWLAANVQPIFAPQTFTELRYSPLVLQWRFLASDNVQLAWWRPGDGGSIDWFALAMPLIGILVGVILLVQQARSAREDEQGAGMRNWLYGAALAIIALAMLTYFCTARGDPALTAVAQRISGLEQEADGILFLTPEQGQAFANAYHGHLPTFGFFGREQLDAAEQAWLDRLRAEHGRLFVVPNYLPPKQSGWERPLRTAEYLLVDEHIPGQNSDSADQRLALYAAGQAHHMEESGLGTVFGDPASQEAVTLENGWIRLKGFAVTREAQPGGSILLTLLWESLQPVEQSYHVFVHLLDERGAIAAQKDGQPVQWTRPTNSWQPGEQIADRYGILLPDTFAPGRYTMAVGLYDPVTGQRLPVSAGPSSYALELGPIEVH